ncbi:hypothetical protein D3C85_1256700 [compost metagenome]
MASFHTRSEELLLDSVQMAERQGGELRRQRRTRDNPAFANHLARPHAPGFELDACTAQSHRHHPRFDDVQMFADLSGRQNDFARLKDLPGHVLADVILLFLTQRGRKNTRVVQQRALF